MFYVLFSLNKN